MEPGEAEPGIVAAARQGDRAAWEQIYRTLYPRLISFFTRRMAYESVEDAVNPATARHSAGPAGTPSGSGQPAQFPAYGDQPGRGGFGATFPSHGAPTPGPEGSGHLGQSGGQGGGRG